ncbi:hypothetical protein TraAM80_04159 [Trypanosoma rangeli]|uniref:Uncharacterized protein n=1 Tax=Trypanosoma rangeli TaxID=5698 RepID=A0A3R7KGJ3_TRYRA|nr:uncharacterized protein TraAM80_04159 [Trypanosoma rangeli]RNF06075.1 hypothetical protein TraAM80_04159 [Trypanosoma rangeli]|eukprot:RNF06075.1 hypothetical protein TraAM80_04159 [Trypanosoma rangeli]
MDAAGVRQALVAGANVNATNADEGNRTVLHIAAALSSDECLLALLGNSPKPFLGMDASGQTPFHLCARRTVSLVPLALLIHAYGLNNAVDHHLNTFLHYLMDNSRIHEDDLLEFMRWLTSSEAALPILNAINGRGETVVDLVLRTERHSGYFLQLLLSAGAREAKDLYAVLQRQVMALEEKLRRRVVASEEKHWRRLRRAFRRHHATLLQQVLNRCRVVQREEDGRRRLWLGEHRERGWITEKLINDLLRVTAVARQFPQTQRLLFER